MPPAVMSVIFEGISAASGLIVTPFLQSGEDNVESEDASTAQPGGVQEFGKPVQQEKVS
ncbi:hypothetical protein RUM43_003103 [Polyplax serrata]|uniref:Uncharacterized protein n=1 Tax=Polyplax serrata TaxID=468196 RepID=A0AAN8S9B9_POLSC